MPTGYTQPIYDNEDIDFPNFALLCSRAFGAAVLLRDYPTTESFLPTEENVVAVNYAQRRRDDIRDELARVMALTSSEIGLEHKAELGERALSNERSRQRREALQERYEEMLAKVTAWEPPTDDHVGLKAFMIEQLEGSIQFDCSPIEFEIQDQTDEEWQADRIERITQDLVRAQQRLEEENTRNRGRVQWVRDLRESLDLEVEAGILST